MTTPTNPTAEQYLDWIIKDSNDTCAMHDRLKAVDFMVLDNSVRETTVGAIKGHTIETKLKILDAIKDTHLTEVILGSFGASDNVDDRLPARWRELTGQQVLDNAWGLGEFWEPKPSAKAGEKKSVPKVKDWVPSAGLAEVIKYKICNAILEIDTCDASIQYPSNEELCNLAVQAVTEMRKKLATRTDGTRGRVLINLRDFANFEDGNPKLDLPCETHQRGQDGFIRALMMVNAWGRMPAEDRPLGIMIEEPVGFLLPAEVAKNVKLLRRAMDAAGWKDARLLVHTHMNFGLAQAGMLDSICAGADGMWGAVCRNGAHLGHACSAVTLANLARYGNTLSCPKNIGTIDPLQVGAYNLPAILKAARRVTELVTTEPCPDTEEVYGLNAFDVAFHGWHGFMQSRMDGIAQLCGARTYHRITEFAGEDDIRAALRERFGSTAEWDDEVVPEMKRQITNDLLQNQRYDYNTVTGLAQLYEVAGGRLNAGMMKKIEAACRSPYLNRHPLIVEIRRRWLLVAERLLSQEPEKVYQARETLPWDTFVKDVCNLAADSHDAAVLQDKIDINHDGIISWFEFEYRLKWTLMQANSLNDTFPTPERLIDTAIQSLTQCKCSPTKKRVRKEASGASHVNEVRKLANGTNGKSETA